MNAIELLKEAIEVLMRGQADEQANLAQRIEDYLAAPHESAMEVVEKIREDSPVDNGEYIEHRWAMSGTDAAALIESYGRRVPRAMLDEIVRFNGKDDTTSVCTKESIGAIAAKYGVEIEG